MAERALVVAVQASLVQLQAGRDGAAAASNASASDSLLGGLSLLLARDEPGRELGKFPGDAGNALSIRLVDGLAQLDASVALANLVLLATTIQCGETNGGGANFVMASSSNEGYER